MIEAEFCARWRIYESIGENPAQRLWRTIVEPLYRTKELHHDFLRYLREKAESNPDVREAFREEFLTHFGFVPGDESHG